MVCAGFGAKLYKRKQPVTIRSSPSGGNVLAAVKTFDANIDTIGNLLVLIVKNSNQIVR